MISLFNIKNFLFSINEDHRRILRGLLVVTFFVAVGKLTGAAKEVAVAYRFGMSEIVDVYVLAFTYAIWIPAIAGTVIYTIYVPLIHKLDKKNADSFAREFAAFSLILAGLATLLLLYLLPVVLDKLSPEYSENSKAVLRNFAFGFAPLAGVGILTAQISTMLLAEERHTNTLFDAIPSLCIIIFVLLWNPSNSANSLLWGTVTGMTLQAVGLYLLLSHNRTTFLPAFKFSSNGWTQFREFIGIVLATQVVMSFVDPVSTAIAANLGTGNVAGLGYSTRLLALFLTLGASAVARAILPVLSNTRRSEDNRKRLAIQWSLLLLAIGIGTAIVTWIVAPAMVQLLFERGAFTAADTLEVSRGVRFGVLQFPFFFPAIVLVQYFISQGNYRIIFISACLALSTKIIFSLIFARYYSFAGIVLASTPMYAANAALFVGALIRSKKRR